MPAEMRHRPPLNVNAVIPVVKGIDRCRAARTAQGGSLSGQEDL